MKPGRIMMPPEARFMRYVTKSPEKNGCWIWTGYKNRAGYGVIADRTSGKPKTTLAHRLSWKMHRGPIPDNLFVCHDCPGGDRRNCVNPAHLFLGTHDDNMQDGVKKGRFKFPRRKGQSVGGTKLSDEVVFIIRQMVAGGAICRAIARAFKVDPKTVSSIVTGKTWKHVGGPITKLGRAYGARSWKSKLCDAIVVQIRKDFAAGVGNAELGKRYGVHMDTVQAIRIRRTWKHLP